MEIVVRVQRQFNSRVNRARLARIASRVLHAEGKDAVVAIYVTGDSEMRHLNRRFHGVTSSTDVLSFPSGAADTLGDIVISYERARVQAHTAHWRIADELDLLAVHGILHLIGYDDLSPRARRKMWARQEEILGYEIRGEKP